MRTRRSSPYGQTRGPCRGGRSTRGERALRRAAVRAGVVPAGLRAVAAAQLQLGRQPRLGRRDAQVPPVHLRAHQRLLPRCAFHPDPAQSPPRPSRFVPGAGAWTSHSRIDHSVSDSLEKPFTFQDVAINTQATNPQIVTLHDSSYAIFYSGSGEGPAEGGPNCSYPTAGDQHRLLAARSRAPDWTCPQCVRVSKSLDGPWYVPTQSPSVSG